MSLLAMLYKGAHAELPRVARHLRHRLVRRARGNVHTDLLGADVPARRRDRVGRGRAPAPVAGPGDHPGHRGRDGRLLHRLRRGPVGRQPAGAPLGPVRADHRVGRGPGGAVPGRARRVGAAGGADAAVRPRLRVDRGRPGGHPAGAVRGAELHRHDDLHRRALQHRVQPRRRSGPSSTTASSLASYILVVVVVLAIIGFVLYRLRAFRREAAEGTVPAPGRPSAPAGTVRASPGESRRSRGRARPVRRPRCRAGRGRGSSAWRRDRR